MRPAAFPRRAAACLALLALAACGEDQITEVGPSIRVVSTHVDEQGLKLLDYGPVPVLIDEPRTLLVYNDGLAPLTLVDAAIATAEDAFHTTAFPAGGVRLQPGEEKELVVYFQPPAEADFEGTLTLHHDDERVPPVEVRLEGIGSTVGRIEVTPQVIDFGRVGEGTQEVRTVTIRSIGTARLIIEDIELAGDTAFTLLGSASTPAELPPPAGGNPGGSVDLLVACSPAAGAAADDLAGTLTIRSTDPEAREIVVQLAATVNRAPIAEIGNTSGVPAPGDPVALDGSGSHDPDGDEPLTYLWRVYRKPLGSEAYVDDPEALQPSLVTDLPGLYVVGLDVADSAGLSCLHPGSNPMNPCATREITVKPADDLYFELVWDHADTDLDLHLLERGAALYSSRDCYYGNATPDFGEIGSSLDDPRLTRDDLAGFGPERIVFSKPPEGEFDVAVVFAKSNGALEPATRATVRVYVYGVLEAEMSRVLDTRDQRWDVLSIEWPSAVVTAIDALDGETETQP